MERRIWTAIAVAVATATGSAGCSAGCGKAPPAQPPPPLVRVATVHNRPIEQTREWLATLDGAVNAEIRPHVAGYVLSVDYQEGSVVKDGTLLFTIDDRPFIAAVQKARGDVESAQAQLGKSRADVARYAPLAAEHAIPQQQLDDARAAQRAAVANVAAMRGSLRTAELNLEWTRVRAPIDGISGIARVRIGNLVDSNQVLTTVSTLDPIRASFNISEQEYLRYAEIINHVNDPQYADTRVLELILVNGQIHRFQARHLIVNREINPQTGTLLMQALFPNPGNILRPGLFAKVRIHIAREAPTVVVPEPAIMQIQGQTRVAVVDENDHVDVRIVRLGALMGHDYIVYEGLRPGERVIIEGQQNAQPGMPVRTEPWTAPAPADGGETTGAGGAVDGGT